MKTMKRFMIYAVAACMAGGSFVACTPEEEDLFAQSSAERLNAVVPSYTDLLCNAPNGWAMEYFVNNDWEPGYVYLMKFNKDTSVKIAGDNVWIGGKYTESTSVFEVITDDGPVLTFNTYNPIFHVFATPDDITGNGAPSDINESGYGHRGDYEFVIEEADDNLVILKGKKWGLTILLRRLADDVDWEEYMAAVKEKKNSLFPKNALDMRMVVGNETYVVTDMQTGVMGFYPEGGDALTEIKKVPYIVTLDGIRLVKPFRGIENKGNFSVQTFRIDEEKGELFCTDAGQNATIRNYEVSKWLLDKGKSWVINTQTLCGRFVGAYEAFAKGLKDKKYGNVRSLKLVYDADRDAYALSWQLSIGAVIGMLYNDFSIKDESFASFQFTGEGNDNALVIMKRVGAVQDFIDLFQSSSYRISYPSPLNSTVIRFESIDNAEDAFEVSPE